METTLALARVQTVVPTDHQAYRPTLAHANGQYQQLQSHHCLIVLEGRSALPGCPNIKQIRPTSCGCSLLLKREGKKIYY